MPLTWKQHRDKWEDCTQCDLANCRRNVVLGRGYKGSLPCDILFVGEAPGKSENMLGKAFIGEAGKLLDAIIERSLSRSKIFFTNLVGCIPLDEDGHKTTEPPKAAIEECAGRLHELIVLARPKVIVGVGTLSAKYLKKRYPRKRVESMIHPAAILRMDPSQQGLACQRCEVLLTDIEEDLYG